MEFRWTITQIPVKSKVANARKLYSALQNDGTTRQISNSFSQRPHDSFYCRVWLNNGKTFISMDYAAGNAELLLLNSKHTHG